MLRFERATPVIVRPKWRALFRQDKSCSQTLCTHIRMWAASVLRIMGIPRYVVDRLGWITAGLTIVVLLAYEFGPKSAPLPLNPRIYVAYYWGDDSFFGRHYYAIAADDGECGHWKVSIAHGGWSPYRGYYSNGTLREEGEIKVWFQGPFGSEPAVDPETVKWGNYYKPDGTLGATVRDGTGTLRLWYPNGRVRSEVEFKDYRRLTDSMWSEEGKLLASHTYDR